MSTVVYRVAWASYDGAGSATDTVTDKNAAISDARARHAANTANGDTWGHRYSVRAEYPNGRTDTIYRAR